MNHNREIISRKIFDTYMMPDLMANDSVSTYIHATIKCSYITALYEYEKTGLMSITSKIASLLDITDMFMYHPDTVVE